MVSSLCVKWEVFNTTGLACDLDSTFAEVIPFAGAALFQRKYWLRFGRRYWEEGAQRAHTSHTCHLCEGQTWAPLHSDFFLTHRWSKEESNITQHHFPDTSPSGTKGSLLMNGEAVMEAPASSQQGSLGVWVHSPLFKDWMAAHGASWMQVTHGFLLARGRNTLTVGRIKLFFASDDYPSCFPREEMNFQLIMTLD